MDRTWGCRSPRTKLKAGNSVMVPLPTLLAPHHHQPPASGIQLRDGPSGALSPSSPIQSQNAALPAPAARTRSSTPARLLMTSRRKAAARPASTPARVSPLRLMRTRLAVVPKAARALRPANRASPRLKATVEATPEKSVRVPTMR